jgi:hypothetical protein
MEGFDPRAAALNHAGLAAEVAERPSVTDISLRVTGEQANAIACGLVYVGDQLAAINEQLATGHLTGIINLLETLDVSVSNGLNAIAEQL